jgi:hypothetical protein
VSTLIRRPLRARRLWHHAAHTDGGLQLPLPHRDDGWVLQGAAAISFRAKRATPASEPLEAATR